MCINLVRVYTKQDICMVQEAQNQSKSYICKENKVILQLV